VLYYNNVTYQAGGLEVNNDTRRASGEPTLAQIGGGTPSRSSFNGIDALCAMLRIGFRADVCLIALRDAQTRAEKLYRATAVHLCRADGSWGRSAFGARLMLRPLDGAVICYYGRTNPPRMDSHHKDADVGNNEARERLAALSALLGVSSMMSVPIGEDEACIGRVYVGSNNSRYSSRDISRLQDGARQARALISSAHLAERLAKKVAGLERRRISRDVHQSGIQPYVALKLGIEAMHRRLRGTPLASDLEELIKIANDGIGELRQYVSTLKNAKASKPDTSLLSAVRTQARKFAEFYGIDADVTATADIPVSAPLQNEVMHIVREGLSNICRHTRAERATINLREARGRLVLELINDKARQAASRKFYPRSIGERAAELGGRVSVSHGAGNRTVVAVELPLHGVGQ
jgi:signal transduction histidine kinase